MATAAAAAAAAAAATLGEQEGVEGGGAGWGDAEDNTTSVVPSPDSPYADLGGVDPVNLISFAYQIASGMVSMNTFTTLKISHIFRQNANEYAISYQFDSLSIQHISFLSCRSI